MLLFSRMVRVHLAKAEGMFKNDILEQDFSFTFVKAVKGCTEKPILKRCYACFVSSFLFNSSFT